jgi:hypothetical protein
MTPKAQHADKLARQQRLQFATPPTAHTPQPELQAQVW